MHKKHAAKAALLFAAQFDHHTYEPTDVDALTDEIVNTMAPSLDDELAAVMTEAAVMIDDEHKALDEYVSHNEFNGLHGDESTDNSNESSSDEEQVFSDDDSTPAAAPPENATSEAKKPTPTKKSASSSSSSSSNKCPKFATAAEPDEVLKNLGLDILPVAGLLTVQ